MSNAHLSVAWQQGNCRANGLTLSYRRAARNRPPLVALHGLFGSGACLAPFAETLATFDLVLPDARGHGGSDAPATSYRYQDLAADVAGLVAALDLERPVLVGHSMGGLTATVAAVELGPAIAALVLLDPTFLDSERQHAVYRSGVDEEHRRFLEADPEALLAAARQRHPGRPDRLVRTLVQARRHTSIEACTILAPPNPDWRTLMRAIAVPTLLVTAGRGVVSPQSADELGTGNPRLRHRHLPDAGHGLVYDAPDQVGAIVAAFLARLDRAGELLVRKAAT